MTSEKTSSTSKNRRKTKIKTMQAVVRLLGVDRGTLENWRSQGCPGLPPDSFNQDAVKKWAADNGKRAVDIPTGDLRAQKTMEEIRKLKLRNDRDEGRVVDRAFVAECFARLASRLNAYRAKSEAEDPVRIDKMPDVAGKRSVMREIWTEIFVEIQKGAEEFK